MAANSSSGSVRNLSFDLNAFLRTLIAPLIVWGVLVAAAVLGGQPGVICVTPMAWLLSLWSGGQYIRLTGGSRGRWPLLGPAMVGAALGVCMGILFILVSSFALPPGTDPSEVGKAVILDAIIGLGGIVACTALSLFTGWLTLNRYRTVS
jgi:hypothetical protein